MPERDRTVWLRVGRGLAGVAGSNDEIWQHPAAVRKALVELQGVFPVTHLEIDLPEIFAAGVEPAGIAGVFREGSWIDRLPEIVEAVADGVRGRAEWGVALPDPRILGGETSTTPSARTLKVGMELAAFLRRLRETSLRFVAVDAGSGPAELAKAVSPILRNAHMYGWTRALCIAHPGEADVWQKEVEAFLVRDADVTDVQQEWVRGRAVGGGLNGRFWNGKWDSELRLEGRCFLFGELPREITPRALVEAGRLLRAKLS